jgi:hypothetical protein
MNKEIKKAIIEIIKLINDNNIIQPIKKIKYLPMGVKYLKPKKKKIVKKKQPKILYGYNTNK